MQYTHITYKRIHHTLYTHTHTSLTTDKPHKHVHHTPHTSETYAYTPYKHTITYKFTSAHTSHTTRITTLSHTETLHYRYTAQTHAIQACPGTAHYITNYTLHKHHISHTLFLPALTPQGHSVYELCL